MANAKRDGNNVPTLIAALNTDGVTTVNVKVNPVSHILAVSDGVTGSDHGPTNDLRDGNRVTCMMGVSSTDGVTPVVVYVDSSGNLLINSN